MNDYSRFSDSSTVFITNSHHLSDSPAIKEGGNQRKNLAPGGSSLFPPTSHIVMNLSSSAPENHHVTPIIKLNPAQMANNTNSTAEGGKPAGKQLTTTVLSSRSQATQQSNPPSALNSQRNTQYAGQQQIIAMVVPNTDATISSKHFIQKVSKNDNHPVSAQRFSQPEKYQPAVSSGAYSRTSRPAKEVIQYDLREIYIKQCKTNQCPIMATLRIRAHFQQTNPRLSQPESLIPVTTLY